MRILSFGEVLFDVFGAEEKNGGAPFNFAAHMARLGASVDLMSAVGNDLRADRVREYMREYALCGHLLAQADAPTGICNVVLDAQGVPSYDLVRPAAWDLIPWQPEVREKQYDLLYFGTLSQRSAGSAETLHRVCEEVQAKYVLFDCNIRQPFVTKAALMDGLSRCTHLKVSREEAPVFAEFGLAPVYTDDSRRAWCRAMARKYGISQVMLTLDRDGAAVYVTAHDAWYERAGERVPVKSTVGAGDSFAAAYMASQLRGESIEQSLDRAVLLSSEVVQSGGIFPEP